MNQEQENALFSIQDGKNTLITGGAGVGKSFTVDHVVDWAHESHKHIGVCAMTGCAALLINGQTLHSFLGIGLAKEPAATLAKKVSKFTVVRERIQCLDILLIDEVSMLSAELFEKVEEFLRLVRKSKKLFGGVQIILVGDPFQLCPIDGTYFFDCTLWKENTFVRHTLNCNMRQSTDIPFKELHDRLRMGVCPPADFELLQKLQETKFESDITPTRLYSKNVSVDAINQAELAKLATPRTSFNLVCSNESSERWAKTNRIPENIQLCVGAQVMCTKNLSELGLVNGSRGVITSISPSNVTMKLVDGRIIVVAPIIVKQLENTFLEVKYLPLKLAWAITIHSSQGMTIDALEVDLGRDIFTCGQAYTGLSRARNSASVRVVSVMAKSFTTNSKVLNFFQDNCI